MPAKKPRSPVLETSRQSPIQSSSTFIGPCNDLRNVVQYASFIYKHIFPCFWFLIAFSFWQCRSDRAPFKIADVKHAQKLVGINLPTNKIDTMLPYLQRNLSGYDSLRRFAFDPEVFPALLFDHLPENFTPPPKTTPAYEWNYPKEIILADNLDTLFELSILSLGALLRAGEITAVELTQLSLDRLERYDTILHSVITLTEARALEAAQRADQELANGKDRGQLHGIPYGIKDLMTVAGYPTTWGAAPYQHQEFNYNASVVEQLDSAGAILVAKLSSGALARGDVWFGGKTLNPWDTTQGASGSSAGSGSAVAARLVPFALGTETLGSIISPSTRCGITGLRPTYGRISRYGTMALAWSMDKIGPMAKSAEDCAIVFSQLLAQDERDPTLIMSDFAYGKKSIKEIKMGVLKSAVDADTSSGAENLKIVLEIFQSLSDTLYERELPDDFPFSVFDIILRAESGAFFDLLVRTNEVDEMVQQGAQSRANSLRQSRFIPAVEYLQANRVRRKLIEAMHQIMRDIDVLISPTRAPHQLQITNLTGHPAMALPIGLDSLQHPTSVTLIGGLFKEAEMLKVAETFQSLTNFEEMQPPLMR